MDYLCGSRAHVAPWGVWSGVGVEAAGGRDASAIKHVEGNTCLEVIYALLRKHVWSNRSVRR